MPLQPITLNSLWGSNPPVYQGVQIQAPQNDQQNNPNVLKGIITAPIVNPVKLTTPVTSTPSATTSPQQVTNVAADNIAVKIGLHNYCQCFVTFTRPNDPNYNSVNVWFRYYNSPRWTLLASGDDSPVEFLCEMTNQSVVVKVVAMSITNVAAPFDEAPTTTMVLNGQMTAPPAPSIAQSVVAIGSPTIGWQFQFNEIQTYTPNVIHGYWIYRSTVNMTPTPPAGRYKYVLNSPTSSGVYTFQDITGVTTQYYYWVSSVDNMGNESSLTSAQSGGGGGAPTYSYSPSAYSGSIFTNSGNAYDGNITTFAYTSSVNQSGTFSGFPTGQASPLTVTLEFSHKGFNITNGAQIQYQYSTNNGSTWTTCFTATGDYSQVTTTVGLSTGTNLTQVQLRAVISGTGHFTGPPPYNALCSDYLYEIWIEETT